MENENTVTSGPPKMPDAHSDNPYLATQLNPYTSAVSQPVDPYGVSQEDHTLGMLVHLLALLTGFVGVLIIWLVKKDQSNFVNHHGKEALNFLITWFLGSLVLMGVSLVVAVLTFGLGMILLFPLFIVIGIGQLVLEIMACTAANRGEWHRYPMTIRFIK